MMLSKDTRTHFLSSGLNIEFIVTSKVEGAFISLKGMTINSKCPYRVLKAMEGIDS